MAILTVLDRQIDVNVKEELEEYEWENATWESNKLIASTPFRQDKSPSFYVDFEGEFAGVWADSGAEDERYSSGTLPSLLAFLRGETFEEAAEYLLEKYDLEYTSSEIELKLSATLSV